VNAIPRPEEVPGTHDAPGTLGALLYADKARARIPEAEWALLVKAVASGDEQALHALYERIHRVVFTLALRISDDRETAEELTVDVFHDVWRRASTYDAESGTAIAWIMNLTRSRAIDRVRHDGRKKRARPEVVEAPGAVADSSESVEHAQLAGVLRSALDVLTPDERQAIETAYFSEISYAEAATRLNQPLGTIKTRIRSGLGKLREALDARGLRS